MLEKGSEKGAGSAQQVSRGSGAPCCPGRGGQSEFQGALQKGGAGEGLKLPGGSKARARVVVAGGGEGPRWLGSSSEPHAPCPPPLQANETFAFVGNVTHYAQVWLNISAEIRSFLEQGRLQQHLLWLQQVPGGPCWGWWGAHCALGGGQHRPPSELAFCPQYVAELRLHPEALNLSLEELPPALRQDNFSLPNGSALLQQLDTIDNAACGWIQFMSKVGWASRTWLCWGPEPAPTMPLPPGERGHLQGFPG